MVVFCSDNLIIMNSVSSVKGWNENNALFKAKGYQINIALGKRKGLEIFNSNIDSVRRVGGIK